MGAYNLILPVEGILSIGAGKGINAKHEEWTARALAYYHIDLLTRGGYEIRQSQNSPNFLWKKPKEQTDVYATRCAQLTYQNLVGTGIAWYVAAMFREEWTATFRKADKLIENPDPNDFYVQFMKNVDRRGTTFSAFLSELFETLLKFQKAWVLTDKPSLDPTSFRTLADQKAAGANDPYVVIYDPRNVINWDEDDQGNLNWVVIWAPTIRRVFKTGATVVDRWYYYDRTNYEVYEAERPTGQAEPDTAKATVIASGLHALAAVKRVPLRKFCITELFWLANRAYPQSLDHLNQDNTYRWSLYMANLPVPYVEGEYEETPTASETELMVLPAGSKFGWTEPAGTSFGHSALRLSSLVQEIYRQMYLSSQGKDASATASALSGYSKEMDLRPATDVCARYAAWLREDGEKLLRDVADARGELDMTASVSGTDFEETDVDGGLATLELMADADLPSDTLEKVVQTEMAMRLARDESEETRDTIKKEIQKAPTKSERMAQQQQQAAGMFGQALTKGINRSVVKGVVSNVQEAA